MAKVPLPDRGQPLDLSYIYTLADAINNLSNQLSPAVNKQTTIDVASTGPQSVRTSDARFIGGYINVQQGSTTTSMAQTFKYSFSDFAYVPIVTATLISTDIGNTAASINSSLILTRVTTNSVEGVVTFGALGVASVGVNLIIAGIPV